MSHHEGDRQSLTLWDVKMKDEDQQIHAEKAIRVYEFVKYRLTGEQANSLRELIVNGQYQLFKSAARDPRAHIVYRRFNNASRYEIEPYIVLWTLYGLHPSLSEFRDRCQGAGAVPNFPLLPDDDFHGSTEIQSTSKDSRAEIKKDSDDSDEPVERGDIEKNILGYYRQYTEKGRSKWSDWCDKSLRAYLHQQTRRPLTDFSTMSIKDQLADGVDVDKIVASIDRTVVDLNNVQEPVQNNALRPEDVMGVVSQIRDDVVLIKAHLEAFKSLLNDSR